MEVDMVADMVVDKVVDMVTYSWTWWLTWRWIWWPTKVFLSRIFCKPKAFQAEAYPSLRIF